MAWEVQRRGVELGGPVRTLDDAKRIVTDDLAHSPAILAPFGGIPEITWAWNDHGALEARGEDGRPGYTIRRVPGT